MFHNDDQLSGVYRQFVESTNLAEVHQKHNGIYEELRSTGKKLESQKWLEAMKFSEGVLEQTSTDKAGKEEVWHINDSDCYESLFTQSQRSVQ